MKTLHTKKSISKKQCQLKFYIRNTLHVYFSNEDPSHNKEKKIEISKETERHIIIVKGNQQTIFRASAKGQVHSQGARVILQWEPQTHWKK